MNRGRYDSGFRLGNRFPASAGRRCCAVLNSLFDSLTIQSRGIHVKESMQSFSRIPEPEIMNDEAQVDAYASADWSQSHDRLIAQIDEMLPGVSFAGPVLNLGCGSGDDTFRFLRRFDESFVLAIDGAPAMIERAKSDLTSLHSALVGRVDFRVAYVPSDDIPKLSYVGVFSNSLLHHMHDPLKFWECVADHSRSGTPIFVADLRRPNTLSDVDGLVARYAADAPPVLREDYRNSLRAAFTEDEVREQLARCGLQELKVQPIGDRHIIVSGIRR